MVFTLWIVFFFAQCIYLRSIIFDMLHLGERLKLQMSRGFQDTPFSFAIHPRKSSPSRANNFQPIRSKHCLTLVRTLDVVLQARSQIFFFFFWGGGVKSILRSR